MTAALGALAGRGVDAPFDLAIVLGSGLGAVSERLETVTRIPYAELPGMPATSVSGHRGALAWGRLAGRRVLVFEGRAHPYETGRADAMRPALALVAALGRPPVLLTNASGGIRDDLVPGTIAALSDHIAIGAANPLWGERDERRFVPMGDAYDPALRLRLAEAAAALGMELPEAVYMWFPGPSFETPAEIRAARALGADLVGMSTVPETILARFHGLRVGALSVVTNRAAGLGGAPSHAETKREAALAADRLAGLVGAFAARIGRGAGR
ncbi:MAG: purine-nucleoside phosphorylase [Methylobacteriaceae bacterium]|nr:purine-nucleoside phosphorylase [Methylobacteriaceae bacterium]